MLCLPKILAANVPFGSRFRFRWKRGVSTLPKRRRHYVPSFAPPHPQHVVDLGPHPIASKSLRRGVAPLRPATLFGAAPPIFLAKALAARACSERSRGASCHRCWVSCRSVFAPFADGGEQSAFRRAAGLVAPACPERSRRASCRRCWVSLRRRKSSLRFLRRGTACCARRKSLARFRHSARDFSPGGRAALPCPERSRREPCQKTGRHDVPSNAQSHPFTLSEVAKGSMYSSFSSRDPFAPGPQRNLLTQSVTAALNASGSPTNGW